MDSNLENIINGFGTIKEYLKRLQKYLELITNNKEATERILQFQEADEVSLSYKKMEDDINIIINLNNDIDDLISEIHKMNLEEISRHFKMFLIEEIANINSNNYHYLQPHNEQRILDIFIEVEDLLIDQSGLQTIGLVKELVRMYDNYLLTFQSKISSVKIFKVIKDINNNIILIGANGSGKSTFARSLKGKMSSNTTILSAQHLLLYTKPESRSTNNKEIQMVYEFQSNDKLGGDPNLINLYSNDFNNLVGALFSENSDREHGYYRDLEKKRDSLLIKTIKIWEKIIEHRKLVHDSHNINVETLQGDIYDFNYLSDGEKAVFYYIAHVLLSKEDSYIIVDEPESHLHLAICNKLWDILEVERRDCKFIYLTHNLDFATSRNDKTVLWNKKFDPPSNWEVVKLSEDEEIPERLLMEIVGSRKDILFCEGNNKTSLDYKLYSILFKDHTIIPVGGHINVINYTRAYNRNKLIYELNAIGIVDMDCHTDDEINSWEKECIYTLPIMEIENLLCDEIILKAAIKRFACEDDTLDQFKDNFFKKLEQDKDRMAVWYANQRVNNKLKSSLLKEERNLENLLQEFQALNNSDLIKENHDSKLRELTDLINVRDYEGALRVSNFKSALINVLPKVIINDYKDRIFKVISEDQDLQTEIHVKYFNHIPQGA